MKKQKKIQTLLIISILFVGILLTQPIQFNSASNQDNRNTIPLSAVYDTIQNESNRTWGGVENEIGKDIVFDSFYNVYFFGETWSFGAGGRDLCLVKYDYSGTQLWNRTWGGNSLEYARKILLDSSENIYLIGVTRSFGEGENDMCIIKFNSLGEQMWNKTWGGYETDYAYDAVIDSLDNIYIAGYTYSFGAGGNDICLVKYDYSGTQLWNRTCGGNSD